VVSEAIEGDASGDLEQARGAGDVGHGEGTLHDTGSTRVIHCAHCVAHCDGHAVWQMHAWYVMNSG
jgi:hypothetical protein